MLEREYHFMKTRRLLAGLLSLAVVASLGSCEKNHHDQNSDASSGIVSTADNSDSKISEIYKLYKENGGTLTYEEWLVSIKGEKGDKGDKGADGNDAPHYGETHTVTYYPNGGTMPSGKSVSETVTWGDCLNLPVPTRPGYTFSGWFYESSDVNDPTRQWTKRDAVFKDITLTAHWESATYTITPNTDGGSVSTTSVKAQYKGSYKLPEPTKSGYNFLGWYNETTQWDLTGIYTETSGVTLTAHWEKKTIYTITLNANGGTSSTASVQTNQDGTYSLPSYENVTRDGYVFKGWFNGTEKWNYSGNYLLTSDITLAANWEAVENYTLILDFNGGTYNASTSNYTFNFDNTNKYNGGEQLPVPAKTGYTFVGYGIGANLASDVASLMDYSLSGSTLKAFYKADDGSLNGDVYEFGNYPKGKVKDPSLIQSLATATDTDSDGWLNYNGKEYTSYRMNSSTSYFEVEPLLWKALDSSTGLLLAMDVIDNPLFYYYSQKSRAVNGLNVYPNNYQYSVLRAWLNSYDGTSYSVWNFTNYGFLNTAFTATERAKIETTKVDNSLASTGNSSNPYVCEDTQDKMFALSVSEAESSSYGLDSYKGRISKATDYASAKGAVNYYWLRSPDYYGGSDAMYVYRDGDFVNYYGVSNGKVGVRPAFRIKIS